MRARIDRESEMKRIFLVVLLAVAAFSFAEEAYLGIFMRGSKVGYTHSVSAPVKFNGKPATKSEMATVIDLALLGQPLRIDQKSTSWTDAKGSPMRMLSSWTSAGRTQTIRADFAGGKIQVTINNAGAVTKKTLTMPTDGKFVEDPVVAILEGRVQPGQVRSFYSFDPNTATLDKSVVKLVGKSKALVRGLPFDATLIEVTAKQLLTKVFVSAKGDFIKAEAPFGIEMIPLTKAEALKPSDSADIQDLALISRIVVSGTLDDVPSITEATFKISGADLTGLLTDSHQSVQKSGTAWLLTTRGDSSDPETSGTIEEAAQAQPEWVKPSFNIPSGSPTFVNLAHSLVESETNVVLAAEKIRTYVTQMMRPNATIGILRDAAEVLKSKEGVCRDYAVLTAALLRGAGIPARMISGLVYQDGSFYYHAWVEAFDGKAWFGVDSTRPDGKVRAGHIKLSQGTVEQAFAFKVLDSAKINVMATKKSR